MTRLLLRIAFAGLSRRPVQSLLVVLVALSSSAALGLASTIGAVADRPYERTLDATNGAHVRVFGLDSEKERVAAAERRPGVVASSGLRPVLFTSFAHERGTFGLRLMGSAGAGAQVDRPLLVEGRLPGARAEIALERSLARVLQLRVGERIPIGPRGYESTVTGIVVLAQANPYPRDQPGLALASEETMLAVEPDRAAWRVDLGLRLDDAERAGAFVAGLPPGSFATTWLAERADSAEWLRLTRTILGLFSVLLLVTSGAVLATLVSGRVLAQLRDIGLLKAAGLSPLQVASTVAGEQVALSFAGAVVGLVVARLAAPLFVAESAALLDSSQTPPLPLATAVAVVGVIGGVTGLFAFVPALRAARRTTVAILAAASGRPGDRSRMGRLAERLGLPLQLVLGVRDTFARPARTWILVVSLALAVAASVATLGGEASLRAASNPPPAAPPIEGTVTPRWDPIDDDAGEAGRLRPILYALDGVLLFAALANLLAAVLLGVRERRRDFSLLKAVGLTPAEIRRGFLAGQATVAVTAVALGLPLGYALFRGGIEAGGSADEFAYPVWWWVLLLVPTAVAVVLGVTAPLARSAANVSVTHALRSE